MRYVKGYLVTFMAGNDIDPPVRLSIEGGVEAIRQRRAGEPTILLGLTDYNTKSIKAISPIFAFNSREAEQLRKKGEAKTEEEVEQLLIASANPVAALPAPPGLGLLDK